MGRQATWNEADLLGEAMAVFRRKGFAQTTVRDLEAATGLHPGSLYKAYGSKDGLFAAALRAYTKRVVEARIAAHLMREDDPLAGIRSFFTSTFECRTRPDPGCLVTNTAIEGFSLDAAARDEVRAGLARIERGLAGALERARTRGQVAPSANVGSLATRLLTLYQGLLVLVRSGAPTRKLRAITGDAIRSVAHPATKGQAR